MRRVHRSTFIILAATLATQPAAAQTQLNDPSFELHQNYPNPFDGSTTIPFTLDAALFSGESPVMVTISLFDIMGHLVAHPVALNHTSGVVPVESLPYESPGGYEALWDAAEGSGADHGTGVYIVELSVDGQQLHRKMFRSAERGR